MSLVLNNRALVFSLKMVMVEFSDLALCCDSAQIDETLHFMVSLFYMSVSFVVFSRRQDIGTTLSAAALISCLVF